MCLQQVENELVEDLFFLMEVLINTPDLLLLIT